MEVVCHNIYLSEFIHTAGNDFTPLDMNMTVLNGSTSKDCVMIQTMYDDHPMNMERQFKVILSESAVPDSIIYKPNMTTITITNRMSA